MSETRTHERPRAAAEPAGISVEGIRVDGAHVLGAGAAAKLPSPPAAEQPGSDSPPLSGDFAQLRLQAQQLADHLRRRLEDLDRRETQLHAQLAQGDRENRSNRLWLAEQSEGFADRETELKQRSAEHDAREAELAGRISEFEFRVQTLDAREAELAAREAVFAAGEAEAAVRTQQLDERLARCVVQEIRLLERQNSLQDESTFVREKNAVEAEAWRATAEQQLAESLTKAEQESADRQRQAEEQIAVQLEQLRSQLAEEQARHDQESDARLAARRDQLEAQIEDRGAELDRREYELAVALDRSAAQQSNLQAAGTALEQRQAALEAKGLQAGDALAGQQLAAGRPTHEELARLEALEHRAQIQADCQRRLEEGELRLQHAHVELQRLRQDVDEERLRYEAQSRADRRRLAEQQRRQECELAARQQAIERLSEELDQRRTAVAQSQAEVTDLHRETLELRLATEELWGQLAGALPPTALAQAIGQTRSRLAHHYRLTLAEIDKRRKELEALRGELAAQHMQLAGQSRHVQDWVAARESELNEQAGRLAAREEELEKQTGEQRGAQEQWLTERVQLEQEVRRLAEQLRRGAADSKPGHGLSAIRPRGPGAP